jgi:CubicO group peptidase (beta-lactamase class C family)
MSDEARVEGSVAPGFEAVAEEFRRNFEERGDLGAAFAAVCRGEPVVDLWGGTADSLEGRPWARDTPQIIFSGSKGLVSMCILLLLERQQLDLDRRVAYYWPEFAAAGKERVLVRDVVAHTARLPGIDTPITWQQATDDRMVAGLLAAQPQSADPRAATAYHSLTFGWLCGELVRRVDGRSIGRFFAEELAQPLALDIWIGLPPELQPCISRVELTPTWGSRALSAEQLDADALARAVANPLRYRPPDAFPWNEPAWHAAEVPAANAIGTARSIARLYASLGQVFSPGTLERARTPHSSRMDLLNNRWNSFGIGFQLQTDELVLGPPGDAFGHGGAGGSLHGCWPTQGTGFSYAMNLLCDDSTTDHRGAALLDALYRSLQVARPEAVASQISTAPGMK